MREGGGRWEEGGETVDTKDVVKLGKNIARLLAENRVPLRQLDNVFAVARGELSVTLSCDTPGGQESP